MILSQTATYALLATSILSRLAPGESLCAVDLAERTGVPVHYLSKVMRRLVLAGLVRSRKGHGGGYTLAREPAKISFHEILAATGDAVEPGQCPFDGRRCDPQDPCPLHRNWSELQEVVAAWASRATLGDTQRRRRSR